MLFAAAPIALEQTVEYSESGKNTGRARKTHFELAGSMIPALVRYTAMRMGTSMICWSSGWPPMPGPAVPAFGLAAANAGLMEAMMMSMPCMMSYMNLHTVLAQ